jgi:amino acid adenylation domain-containing protein
MNARTDVVTSLLAELAQVGVTLRLVGDDRIEVTAPRGGLSAELRDSLARHKAELVGRLARVTGAPPTGAEIPPVRHDPEHLYEPFAPTDLQQSFLIGSREGFEYHVRPHGYLELDFADLDPDRFQAALNRAVHRQRHNIVVVRDGTTLQTVRDPAPVEVRVHDLRGRPTAEAEDEMLRIRAAMQREEPPHDRWPWLRPRISRYGDGRARLHYNNNNFFTDAPSSVGLVNDALHYYHHPDRPLPELTVAYRDCALALAELEESPLGKAAERYWHDRLADWPDAPALPLVPGAEHRGRSMLHRRQLVVPAEQWTVLKQRSEAAGLTPTNVLLGAHCEVIAYWSGSRHFLLNNMITHRQIPLHPQVGEVLGNFASLYPLEVDWRPDEPFRERVRRLQSRVLADVAHLHYSGAKVLQALNRVRRTPGRASCPFAVGSALFVGRGDRPYYSMLETPQTLLDTEFWELSDGSLWVVWDVIEAMFPDGLIDAMLAGYRRMLDGLAGDGSVWESSAVDLLPPEQRARRESLGAAGATPAGLLHDALPVQAARRPQQPLVIAGDATAGYGAVAQAARQVAGRLHERGVGPGDRVAVVLPKSAAQYVAVLGTLTAGAAYVPIDPQWPDDRIRYLLGDTTAAAVLTSDALAGRLTGLAPVPVLAMSAAGPSAGPPATAGPLPAARPEDLAYVIYTSGSTGRPKGVMLDHRGPLNTVLDINARFGVTESDVLFGISSLCFDLSVYDIFGAVAAGATVVLPDTADTDPAQWLRLVRKHEVTVWNSVPAIMQLLVERARSAGVRLPGLRLVLLSGDWIPVDLPEQIREIAPQAQVVSLGGATEASIWSICYPVRHRDPSWTSIPYGRPLANQSWDVLDDRGRPAPVWTPGQLAIGGAGLSLGYLNDPEKTGRAFVAHPVRGDRIYLTGDLGRYLPSGDIEFLGRADAQVKIQGFRVELGEIEHALLACPGVGRAAVVNRDSPSGRQLSAFVTPDGPQPPTEAGLRTALAATLPAYMVPTRLTVLERLPLTGNGKVDRTALAGYGDDGPAADREYRPPRGELEQTVAEIWREILGPDRIDVRDDFFDLGGQSFAALRVAGRIAQRLGRRVPLGALLEHRTVAGLAAWLAEPDRGWSPLVRVGDPEATDPWFWVHPAGGDVLCYRELADLLDRPSAAFQAPGPASGHRPLETLDELAEGYLAELLRVRPHGPYSLGGWSSGAIIALELAHRLEQRGERVRRLVVLDAPAPLARKPVDEADAALWFVEDLNIGFDAARVTPEQRATLAALDPDRRLAGALELATAQGATAAGVDPAHLGATFAVFRGVVRACNSRPGHRVAADVTVLRAADGQVSEFGGHPHADRPDWGWAALTGGRVTTRQVPGTHHTLLTDRQAVTSVAGAINQLCTASSEEG